MLRTALTGRESIWHRDLGDKRTRLDCGEGSSPLLAGGRLVVIWDHEGDSLLVVLDAATGRCAGATRRRSTASPPPWAAPVDGMLWVKDDKGIIYGIDAATGEFYHGPQRLDGVRGLYASPVGADDRVYPYGTPSAVPNTFLTKPNISNTEPAQQRGGGVPKDEPQ